MYKGKTKSPFRIGCRPSLKKSSVSFVALCAPTCGSTDPRVYLGMSTGKPTDPSAAEMLSTMEVKARMFPCSGDSAALSRSAEREGEAGSWSVPVGPL